MSERKLTLWDAVGIGLGNIIGAGIFVMAGSTIDLAGPGALISFLFTAMIAFSVALNSAELSSEFPDKEGGVYTFAKETMGNTVGFLVGWMRMISYVFSGSAVALGFASYVFPSISIPIARTLIIMLSLIYSRGLKIASELEKYISLINVTGLLIFAIVILSVSTFSTSHFTPVAPHGINGILEASSLAFFAYSGFNTVATLTPSVKDGVRNVPRAIILSLSISSIIYILIVFSMLYGVPWQKFGVQGDPLRFALILVHAPYWTVAIVSGVALLSTFSVTLSLIIASVRTTEQIVKDKLIPRTGRFTLPAISSFMILSLFFGNVEVLGLISNFGTIFSYLITPLAVFIGRKRLKPTFRSPFYPWVQLFSLMSSLVIMSVLGDESLVVGLVSLLIGLIIHVLHVEINFFERERSKK